MPLPPTSPPARRGGSASARLLRALTLLSALASLAVVGVAGAASESGWSPAREVTLPPGATGLPQGYLPVLACPSSGNCVAAGDYNNAHGQSQGLLVNEVNGAWRSPLRITPPANAAANAALTPYGTSCASVGACVSVGTYQDRSNNVRDFVISEVHGSWQRAVEVQLPANALAKNQLAQLHSVACTSVGNCSAVGTYLETGTPVATTQALVVDEVQGQWRVGERITLPPTTNSNPFVTLGQVACSTPGNCSAIGSYIDSNNVTHGLLVDEIDGRWLPGMSMDLPPNASPYPNASLSSIACPGVGDCTATGTYQNARGFIEGLHVNETHDHWNPAVSMPMPPNAATDPHTFFYGFAGVACPAATTCSVGGQYRDRNGRYQGFFVNELNGTWQNATQLLLPRGALMAGKNGGVVSVSCAAVGSCSAGAAYLDGGSNYQGLVVNEVHGVWGTGLKVTLPGVAASVGVDGGVYAVVCHPSQCTAVGSYLATATVYQGFLVTTK